MRKAYEVITTATVRRTYFVHASSEKGAIAASVNETPESETDVAEEIVSVIEAVTRLPAAKRRAK